VKSTKYFFLVTIFLVQSTLTFASKPDKIAVSVPPVAFIVQEIGGDKIDVLTMVPPDSNPHFYEPSIRRMISFSESGRFFSIGSEFEQVWLDRLLSLNDNMKVRSITQHLSVSSGVNDPHVWMSPSNVKRMAEEVLSELSKMLPAEKAVFNSNYESFAAKIDDIKNKIDKITKKCDTDKFITVHPVFGFFASEFRLEQIAVEKHGHEPSARYLSSLMEIIEEEKIKFIFSQPQVSQQYVKVIVEETGIAVEMIDPLSNDLFIMFENILSVFNKYCR